LIDRLRRQADMAHDADLLVDEPLHKLNTFVSALEFDCFRATFLHESQRISHRVVIACVKSSIRHVCNQQRALDRSSHGFQMNQYFIQRYRHGIAVTQNHIAQTVADQNDVDACFVDDPSGWIIVRCQTNEAFAALFTCAQRRCTDLFRSFRFQVRHFQLSLHHDLWTIELPGKRKVWKCSGRANKCRALYQSFLWPANDG